MVCSCEPCVDDGIRASKGRQSTAAPPLDPWIRWGRRGRRERGYGWPLKRNGKDTSFGELGYLDAMKAVLDHRGEDYAK